MPFFGFSIYRFLIIEDIWTNNPFNQDLGIASMSLYSSESDSDNDDQCYDSQTGLPVSCYRSNIDSESGSDLPSNEEDDDDEDEPIAPPDYSNVRIMLFFLVEWVISFSFQIYVV